MKICPRCSEVYPEDAANCGYDGTPLASMVDPMIGRTVGGRYRLVSLLGSGGMSSVYLAKHMIIDRLMAIKTLRRELSLDPVQRDRFIREARAVNRINHDNIVEITDFGETEDGVVYLVMEYVPGEPLRRVLQRGPMRVDQMLHLAEQAGAALGRAHQMGIVHRDLKPENILLVPGSPRGDYVKILDFGIAKILDAPSITGSQQIFGTPGYIAPEYIQSAQIDGRADIYSLGVILYEAITGALPFYYEYPGDLLVKHMTDPPIPPRERNPEIPVVIEDFILRALEKNPDHRYRDAFHLLHELDRVRESLGVESYFSQEVPLDALEESPNVSREQVATYRAPPPDIDIEQEEDEDDGRPTLLSLESHPSADVSIPEAPPSTEQIIESASSGSRPSLHDIRDDGPAGVKRWRRRFEAIEKKLAHAPAGRSLPGEVKKGMKAASAALEILEKAVEKLEERESQIEDLMARARAYRASFGKTIDAHAQQLSEHRGELAQLAARGDEVNARREALKKGAPNVHPGESEALLWESAAIAQQLRGHSNKTDELERQLSQLQRQLESQNEQTEREIAEIAQWLDREAAKLEPLGHAVREPLDLAEQFVRSWKT